LTDFNLHPRQDTDELRAHFARHGRVRIAELLEREGAAALRDELALHSGWRHVLNGGDQIFESAPGSIELMEPAERAALEAAVMQSAAQGFQFRYDSIRVPDDESERATRSDLLTRFAEFMSSDAVLGWLAEITDDRSPQFADAQATRYRAGHFLTTHDDDVAGKNRSAAYVYGLSPEWRPEWGGLLLFTTAAEVTHAGVPGFNCLDLFAVGQSHSVSPVAAYAPADRISVTGWLRRRS